MIRYSRHPQQRRRPGETKRGFSAVEMLAVATIIAILALILVPILRGRVSEARVTAATYEMNKLAGALVLAHEDTGDWFRLQDLDNTQRFTGYTGIQPTADHITSTDVPSFAMSSPDENATETPRLLTASQRTALSQEWLGPYISANNTILISELLTLYPNAVTQFDPTAANITVNGPIFISSDAGTYSETAGLYPLDPWGNPYFVFFETEYGGHVLYSMGPNGVPGDLGAPVSDNYRPYYPDQPQATNTGYLGSEDDLHWKF